MTEIKGDSSTTLMATLKAAGLANGLTEKELDDLASIATEQKYSQGVAIIREDAKSRDLYIIHQGRVSVRLKLPSELGREEVIYQMRDGQIFGELSLVDGSPRSATVQADEDVFAFRFEYDRLSKLLTDYPRIGYIMMRNIAGIIANRVRNTNMLWRNSLIW